LASTAADVIELHRIQRLPVLHDPLTGLADRALFAELVAQAVTRAGRSGECVAVLAFGIDGFRLVNEALGPPAATRSSCRSDSVSLRRCAAKTACAVSAATSSSCCARQFATRRTRWLWPALREAVIGDPIDIEGRDQPIAATIGVACTTSQVDPPS